VLIASWPVIFRAYRVFKGKRERGKRRNWRFLKFFFGSLWKFMGIFAVLLIIFKKFLKGFLRYGYYI
jgi:hypothetical protein